MQSPERSPPDTADRLRDDLDHGRGGDKVDFRDPAAAPLGTDDEAAGTPPTREQLRLAREAEVHNRPDDPSQGRPDRDLRTLFAPVWGGERRVWIAAVSLLLLLILLVALRAF